MTAEERKERIDSNIHIFNSVKILLSNIDKSVLIGLSQVEFNEINKDINDIIERLEKTKNELFR